MTFANVIMSDDAKMRSSDVFSLQINLLTINKLYINHEIYIPINKELKFFRGKLRIFIGIHKC